MTLKIASSAQRVDSALPGSPQMFKGPSQTTTWNDPSISDAAPLIHISVHVQGTKVADTHPASAQVCRNILYRCMAGTPTLKTSTSASHCSSCPAAVLVVSLRGGTIIVVKAAII